MLYVRILSFVISSPSSAKLLIFVVQHFERFDKGMTRTARGIKHFHFEELVDRFAFVEHGLERMLDYIVDDE